MYVILAFRGKPDAEVYTKCVFIPQCLYINNSVM